ncbi:MAG: 4-(cytidine 5'-diphospho)-2-C-methyl-D-erythritol kinase [Dehalococcoidales bacterium]|nr:4-(cytidine 5'-diphospho)-2-C-methyl-D-erythritol kinase [Dehalococcoidales bacterium]
MLNIKAPAKLNLTLEVLGKRPDSFHEIRSVIQTINLYDNITMQLSRNIDFRSDMTEWNSEKSLVSQAIILVQQAAGCSKGVTIDINKHIPLESGLGGDSSDAAAVMSGLNQLWELNLSREKLVELASHLGSDVAFFLYGGTAFLYGRGEMVKQLPSLTGIWLVLLVPPITSFSGKTGWLYASLKAKHYTKGRITDRLANALSRSKEIKAGNLYNVFDKVAFNTFTGLEDYREYFLQTGIDNVHVAGSGPVLYTLVKNKDEAEKIYFHLWQQGLEAYLVETLSAI